MAVVFISFLLNMNPAFNLYSANKLKVKPDFTLSDIYSIEISFFYDMKKQ